MGGDFSYGAKHGAMTSAIAYTANEAHGFVREQVETVGKALVSSIAGMIDKLGESSFFRQSANPATGVPIKGNHLVYPLKGLGNAASKAAPWVAVGVTAAELNEIWSGPGVWEIKSIKSFTAININTGAYALGALTIAGSSTTGLGIGAGVGIALGLGYGAERLKVYIYNQLD